MTNIVEYDFDFAVSYAGEDSEIARNLCRLLQTSGAKVFFSEQRTQELWGNNLHDDLGEVFQKKSRFYIPLISRAYVTKYWPLFEWFNIRISSKGSEIPNILPVRLDHVDFPGLSLDTSYMSIEDHSLEEIAHSAISKLRNPGSKILEEFNSDSFRNQLKTNPNWARTGALFWIGYDLQWVYIEIMQGGTPDAINHKLRQCYLHASRLNLGDGIVDRLQVLRDQGANFNTDSDWEPQHRGSFGYTVREVFNLIGQLAIQHENISTPDGFEQGEV